MIHWLNQIHQFFETKTPFVLATIWSIDGTSPDSAGARLVVTNTTCHGQLQSSHRQTEIISQCRKLLASNDDSWFEKSYSLGDVAGTPNGHCSVVFEKFIATTTAPDWLKILRKSIRDGDPAVLANQVDRHDNGATSSYKVVHDTDGHFSEVTSDTRIIINNKNSTTLLQLIKEPYQSIAVVGHSPVAESLVQQLSLLPFQTQWLTEPGRSTLQGLQLQHIPLNDQAIESLTADTKIAIATNNHELDIRCCYLALLNPQLHYVGCLGSQKKARIVKARLSDQGISASRLSALTMPIGLESIKGKQPSVIAASIVAQLLSDD